MIEKRRAVRYRVGQATTATLLGSGGDLVADLADISTSGAMLVVPEDNAVNLRAGCAIEFAMQRPLGTVVLRGLVMHCSPVRRGMGVGLAFTDRAAAREAAVDVFADPEAGGIRLQREAQGITLCVLGRLSFATSRDCLSLVRRGLIRRIDLANCTSVDSAGLGTLCIARDEGIAIGGGRGMVKQMLAVARITAA